MTTIVKRIAKGSTLTVAELDANVTNLNNTKLETTGGTLTGLPVLANQDIDIISPVYPTTKPSLNLDFTRGQLDPRITFARNSTAAYYDGQTSALAEQNLLLWSQDFSNAFWIKSGVTAVQNNATAPDGTMTAATLTSVVGGYLFNSIVGTFSGTFSIYIRRTVGTGNITVRTAAGVDTPITVTSTWSRVAIASTNPNFVLGLATTGDAVEIWGVQAEARASVTAYTPTTTAAITNYIPVLMTAPAGVARFDCDPITGKPLGLLIEESRTNFLTYSGSISPLTAYTEFSTTINTLQNISPDGTLSASLLTPSAVNSEHYAYTSNTAPLTSGTSYTYSIYVKAKGYNFVTLFLGNGAFPSAGRMANFNLLAGVVDGAQSGVTTSIFSVGDGWYRCSITATCVLSSASIITGMGAQNISNPSGNNLTFTGVGTSGIYIWGAQVEAGSFATSYIPTVASTVTRAADQASMTGTNFSSWYNQAQGSFCIDYLFGKLPYAGYLYDVILGVGSTSPAQSNEIIIGNANGNVYYELGFNIIAIGVNGPASSLTKNITALSYGNSTFIGVTNGSINTSPLVINGTNFNILKLGCNTTTGQPLSAGHIRKLSYYPVALSSSNLVALTS